MATLDQIASQRKKDLLAAEIAARREQAKQEAQALLDKFDPSGGRATKSFMPPDPTWQGTGRQEVPGDKETILDRLIQPPVDVPMVDMPPMAIGRDRPFPMERRVDVPVVNRGDLERLEPVTSRFMPSVPPPKRGREPTATMYPAYTDAMAAFDQLVKAKAAEAERVDDPRDSNLALVAAARADVAEMQADIDKKFADRRAQAAGTAVPTALIPRAEPTQQQPTRPYWETIESRMGPNIRSIVGDARADEMEMDLFGPAVTPGAVTRGGTTQAVPTQRTARSEAVDVLSQINRKKNILRAVSSIWGTKDRSQSYETTALAKYAGHLDRMAAQAVLAGGPPESHYQVIADFIRHEGSVKGAKELATALFAGQTTAKPPGQRTIYDETHKIGQQWVPDASQPQGGYWIESWRTPIRDDDTNINLDVDLGKKGSIEFDKNFSSHLANLLMDPEQVYASIETESAQLPLLIDELSSGGLDVGAGQEGLLRIQQAMVRWLPPDLVSDLQRRNVGAQEWFKAVSDSFVGNKLKMTKGSISEREMKIFMDMIPKLDKSTEGNIRLLNMMHALNRIALSRKYGAEKFAEWVGTQEGGMAELRPTQKFLKLKEYQTDELKRSVRFLKYLQKQPVGRGYPPVPLDRVTAFMQLRNANTSEVTDQQINDQLDKWGYPSD